MSIDQFPERIKPRKLCNRNDSINSTIPLGKLLRLSEYLTDNNGQVEASLEFSRDEAGICHISGRLKADVRMLCQRCLEATQVNLSAELDAKVADSEKEAEQMQQSSSDPLDKLEVVICEEGELDLLSLIEDELIMSLPIVASHDNEQCNEELNDLQVQASQLDETAGKQGPLAGLEALQQLKQELKKNSDSKD